MIVKIGEDWGVWQSLFVRAMSFIRERYERWIQKNYAIHQVGQASWQYRPVTKLARQLDTLKFVSSVFTLFSTVLFSFLYPLSIVFAVLFPSLRLAVADRLFINPQWIWPLLISLIVGVSLNLPVFALQEPIPPNQRYKYKALMPLVIKRLFSRNRGWLPTEYVRVNLAGLIIPVALALYQLRFSSPIMIGLITIAMAILSYTLNGLAIKRNKYNASSMPVNLERMVKVDSEPAVDVEGITSLLNKTFSSTAVTVSLAMLSSLLCTVMLSLIFMLLPQSLVGDHTVSIAFSIFCAEQHYQYHNPSNTHTIATVTKVRSQASKHVRWPL